MPNPKKPTMTTKSNTNTKGTKTTVNKLANGTTQTKVTTAAGKTFYKTTGGPSKPVTTNTSKSSTSGKSNSGSTSGKPNLNGKVTTLPTVTVRPNTMANNNKPATPTKKVSNITYVVKTGDLRDPNAKWKTVSEGAFNTSTLPKGAKQKLTPDQLKDAKKRGLI